MKYSFFASLAAAITTLYLFAPQFAVAEVQNENTAIENDIAVENDADMSLYADNEEMFLDQEALNTIDPQTSDNPEARRYYRGHRGGGHWGYGHRGRGWRHGGRWYYPRRSYIPNYCYWWPYTRACRYYWD